MLCTLYAEKAEDFYTIRNGASSARIEVCFSVKAAKGFAEVTKKIRQYIFKMMLKTGLKWRNYL